MSYTAQELFEILNDQDECPWIEAKGGSDSSHSVMETVCSFSNEPGLGGGYILMGVALDTSVIFPQYKISGVNDPDKFQRDFATQCAGMFNLPIRPEVFVEKIEEKNVIKIWINELAARQKPVYFRSEGLPSGALRRIGSTDQHCTDDDMHVFYQDTSSYDQTPVKGINIADTDENAINMFNLNDPQKQSLIFVREVGAIDNQTYRQMADCDTLKASTDLRMLKSYNLFASKGKGKATYYIPGPDLSTEPTAVSKEPTGISTQPPVDLSTQPVDLRTPPPSLRTPPPDLRTPPPSINSPVLIDESLQKEIDSLKQREHDSDKIKGIIMEICKDRCLSAKQISTILNREEDYIKRKYLSKMIKSRNLVYLHAEMINHPEQAYITSKHH